MKFRYIYALVLVLLIGNCCMAQTEQGKFVIGGTTNLSLKFENYKYNIDNSSTKYSTFQAYPEFGFFLIDNLSLGLRMGYLNSWLIDEESPFTIRELGINPFARYYILETNIRPYVDLSAGYHLLTSLIGRDKKQYGGIEYSGGVGVAYFISKSVSLDAQMNYKGSNLSLLKGTDFDAEKIDTRKLGFRFGVYVYL
ncbi:MAG: outer membrane beta-barrel protein [Bacteroidales bacterium]|nr:outer membrane beta-barrel protein [Bacteroidales bacterium]